MSTCVECGSPVRVERNPFTRYFAMIAIDVATGRLHRCPNGEDGK